MTATPNKDIARTDRFQLPTAIKQVRADLNAMETQFANALPPHIPAARFVRVTMTAIQNKPALLRCDRQSLFNALMKCAQDGLLPDGREAAIVPFGENEETGRASADTAQYLPMIAGIRKKVRNSGALADWNVQVVQDGDFFAYQLGDNPFIHHKPSLVGGRTRKVIAAYSIATYPDGTISREVMNADQLEDIRKKSRAKKGPWSDPVFVPEMCRKTVARLHSKQLPMSTDLDRVMHRDDPLYDFEGAREENKRVQRPGSAADALDWFAGASGPGGPNGDQQSEPPPSHKLSAPMTAGAASDQAAGGADRRDERDPGVAGAPDANTEVVTDAAIESPQAIAYRRGSEARAAGATRRAIPGEYRDPARSAEALAWYAGHDDAAMPEKKG